MNAANRQITCDDVSGLYRAQIGSEPGNLTLTIRVDVDRVLPQNRISIEVVKDVPAQQLHLVANVTADECLSSNNRIVKGIITYSHGLTALLMCTSIEFKAKRTINPQYDAYSLEIIHPSNDKISVPLSRIGDNFGEVEFEIDQIENAGDIFTTINTHDHPNRPRDLPEIDLSIANAFEQVGFDVTMSPATSVIPLAGAGQNAAWSSREMHNAMVTFWSRFDNDSNWAMWVLYAGLFQDTDRFGRPYVDSGTGGIMFDDIGPNHRQGTAIFTDSFISDVPDGERNPLEYQARMQFWTAVHEIGHGFNLAHSWQKSLGQPWVQLGNEPTALSYMNYPYRSEVGGETTFFRNFRYQFSTNELIFLRHAPREFVQMGNANWFVNHSFSTSINQGKISNWKFDITSILNDRSYSFMEPVVLELELTNISEDKILVDEDLFEEGHDLIVFVQRDGGSTKQWRPMMSKLSKHERSPVSPKDKITGSILVSCASSGWLIDEPGFYTLQAVVGLHDEIVYSNVLRIFVDSPQSKDEVKIAPDYFVEDVARVLYFNGAPALKKANDTLATLADMNPKSSAALHSKMSVSLPKTTDFKLLNVKDGRNNLKIDTKNGDLEAASKEISDALFSDIDLANSTLGEKRLLGYVGEVSSVISDHDSLSNEFQKSSLQLLEKNGSTAQTISRFEKLLAVDPLPTE